MSGENINYSQEWASQIVERFRKVWNGLLKIEDYNGLFDSSFVFNHNGEVISGVKKYIEFIKKAKEATENLDLLPIKTLAFQDKILLYFQWSSERWHEDIIAGNKKSNFCKIVFRIEDGKIIEKWEQPPDFIYLLGKELSNVGIDYPEVPLGNMFVQKETGLYVTQDSRTIQMRDLFKKMNGCFFGTIPMRKITEALNHDVSYQKGDEKGVGIESWKAFAYVLHTAFDKERPKLFEDIYIREGNRMTVIVRWKFHTQSPYILNSTNGIVSILEFEIENDKIQKIYTHKENYLSFLGTDFSKHQIRTKHLFQGGQKHTQNKTDKEKMVLEGVQEKYKALSANKEEQVAIVGIAGKFPKCDSIEDYWQMLVENKSAFSEVSDARPYLKKGEAKMYAGLLDEVDKFDATFFNIPPVQAEYMDPQQRLLMETIWHSMEDSGHQSVDYRGKRTGLFVSTLSSDYSKLLQDHHVPINEDYWKGNESAIFPAQIARFFDIQGPCKFVNTECASGLFAIHEASQLIKSGKIDQAIVGGTNLILHHYGFLVREDIILSKEKQSYIFSEKSQGQLRGEAIVSIILKSLTKAIEDNDKIYGIVEGSAINNSGKTFSIIAPDTEKQAEVIMDGWKDASIKPSDMKLIECYASGVREGDFAEITAIKKAYKASLSSSEELPSVQISTVKGAIGHAEAVSGLTGLIKLLLQLQHKIIPKGKGIENIDPNLRIDQTNLNLIDENTTWEGTYKNGELQPRIAGINAFAAGGYNAHVVIKEYIETVQSQNEIVHLNNIPLIFPLSGRNEESLIAVVQNLVAYLDKESIQNVHDIAYTLQVARDRMEKRLVVIAENKEHLIKELTSYLNGDTDRLYLSNDQTFSSEISTERITEALQKKEQEFLAQAWIADAIIDWNVLYANKKPQKVNIPRYPFLRKKYWIPESEGITISDISSKLHPLLHSNISNLSEQKFRSLFTGKESFLLDHRVKENKVLAGVAYLEMAREAGAQSIDSAITQISNINWLSPLVVNGSPEEVYLNVFEEGNALGYEVYSGNLESESIHSQGCLSNMELSRPDRMDIESLRTHMKGEKSGADCYSLFKELGFDYGSSFQGIERLYYGGSGCLSKISLEEEGGYVLQPGLLDSALQTCIGMGFDGTLVSAMSLPFSVREVNLYDSVNTVVWCYARESSRKDLDKGVNSFDIDMLSDSGEVLLSFRDFVTLPVEGVEKEGTNSEAKSSLSEEAKLHLYSNDWEACSIVESDSFSDFSSLILLAGGSVVLADKLQESFGEEVIAINEVTELDYYHSVQEILQSRLSLKDKISIRVLYRNSDSVDYGFISGLLKTAEIESSKFCCKTIGVESLSIKELDILIDIIKSEESCSDKEVRYMNGKREVRRLSSLLSPSEATGESIVIKEGGVYLITGGTGGLGQIFANHISNTNAVTLVLTGRGEKCKLSPKELASINGVYYCCDVTDMSSVKELIGTVVKTYGKLDGVIHSAGVVKDSFLVNKTKDESKEVLSPKILGVRCLDESTKDLDLDFMIYFSSLAAVMGNAGQADYSSANAWMDGYASYRNVLVNRGKRSGHTLSINWPLWEEGGMQIDTDSEEYLAQKLRIFPLPIVAGLTAFEKLLGVGLSQGIVVFGQSSSLIKAASQSNIFSSDAEGQTTMVSPTLEREVSNTVLRLISEILKLDIEEIVLDEDLGDYGFDSILLTKLSNTLNIYYDLELMPTLFYSYRTINSLVKHLITDYPIALSKRHSVSSIEKVASTPVLELDSLGIKAHRRRKVFSQTSIDDRTVKEDTRVEVNKGVAIIGMSGRFPGSPDVNTFWNNIKNNKDLITEIPSDRWDWKPYYGNPHKEKSKTKAKWGGFIDDIDKFDPLFFNISPREAELMDPQQRIILESVYHALENANIRPEDIKGSNSGVFIGVSGSDYATLMNGSMELKSQAQYPTGSLHSVLANRISYLLDLHGPSEPIDTACSSSLIAIHRAVECIQNGQCDMAIAGGVNALLSPDLTLAFSHAGMLNDKGRCKTFDESANGYVRGEGVGIIILKSLVEAKNDGDHIYGIIRGTAENHGGKANTLTSPNPLSQKELIAQAYRSAGISPNEVTYIEAHGTGTPLGDPIEIEGLNLAFKELYKEYGLEYPEKPHCSIGSVKTNIGHLEAAAGIAGVIKLLLSLKYKKIPGNVHLNTPNKYLKLDNSPFYLQKETTDWNTDNNKPRIAGISSFGFGGANSHIIIEEYIPKEKAAYRSNTSAIIILSAKNKDRLKELVSNLHHYVSNNSDSNLYDIAYTLQMGREYMEERLAFVCSDIDSLLEKLTNYTSKREDIYQGNIKKDSNDFILQGNAGKSYIEVAIRDKELASLAQLWTKGVAIDWNLLYKDIIPQKISLPSYPFARDRYWIPSIKSTDIVSVKNQLHPLLHHNVSDLKSQKFKSLYLGQEPFLLDHKVNKEKVFPGVGYLELAREAGRLSLHKRITRIKDISWLSPFRLNGSPQELEISLYEESDMVHYQIYSFSEESEVVHSQGKLLTESLSRLPSFDLLDIKSRLDQERDGISCYEFFRELGLDYGVSFQGIDKLYYNSKESLSRLNLSKDSNYVLQPGLLDSALQTCIGVEMTNSNLTLSLPFSVKEVTIYGEISSTVWSYVKKRDNPSSKLSSFDVYLLSESGEVLLSFQDFTTLPLTASKNITSPTSLPNNFGNSSDLGFHLYTHQWEELSINLENQNVLEKQPLIVLAGGSVALTDALQELLGAEVIAINTTNELEYYDEFLALIKARLVSKESSNIIVLYQNSDYLEYSFIRGILKTVEQESPDIDGKLIGVPDLSINSLEELQKLIKTEESDSEKEIRYLEGVREVKSILPLPVLEPSTVTKTRIKEGGVYLITGGTGGLGQIFASHIAKTKDTVVVLVGRRRESPLTNLELQSLNSIYISCDITDKQSLASLKEIILSDYGKLDGIIHSAGIVKDSFLKNKTKEESELVLKPKINGAKYLDQMTKDLDLDFMVLFSSISGVFGNVGQGDYSSANAWLDDFSMYRNDLKSSGKRKGDTISINWPLWEDGGMKIAEESEKYLEKKWGIIPLPSHSGCTAFDLLLEKQINQGIVLYGQEKDINKKLLNKSEKTKERAIQSKSIIELQESLRTLISELLKLDKEIIELEVDFSEYGIDSIMMMTILSSIEDTFEIIIEPTAIVNYPTISLLSSYLQDEIKTLKPNIVLDDSPVAVPRKQKAKVMPERGRTTTPKKILTEKKIAIIGMSCVLPGADNIEEYWNNLKEGKNVITDIPRDRWNSSDHYSEQGGWDKMYTTKGGFIRNAGAFDTEYFKINEDDAISMDPQQRIVLELTRSLLAHAGYKKEEINNTQTSVYIGAKDNSYVKNNYNLLPDGAYQRTIVNNISNMIAARVSDFYNLKGASQTIDTACSSSLVAIHQGCNDIFEGKTDMVIAGGISIMVDAFGHIGFSQAGVLSKDDKSYVFDDRAQGFVMGEGGGLVLLKSYEKAKIDGDHIYGVISSSSVNNDGKTMGLTVPNKEGQKEVISNTLLQAKIDPKQITYYEAHGTGTLLGDPIEVKAASEVYQTLTKDKNASFQYCAIGSVKSNIGHTMLSAGVSGLIKILLQLKNKMIVPTLNCERPHPRFKFKETPFYPNTELKPWHAGIESNRKAALSSFGFGGTNCHMIIEEEDNKNAKRKPLPIEYLSSGYYWLGEQIVKYDSFNKKKTEENDSQYLIKEQYSYNEPIMRDHLIHGNQVLMGVAHLSLSINAAKIIISDSDFQLSKVLFSNPMKLKAGQTALQGCIVNSSLTEIQVQYEIADTKNIASTSRVSKIDFVEEMFDINFIKENSEKHLYGIDYYKLPNQDCYGETAHTLKELWYLLDGRLLAKLEISPEQYNDKPNFLIHPLLFDGAHLAASLSLDRNVEKGIENHRPPLMIKNIQVSKKIDSFNQCYTLIVPKKTNDQISEFDIALFTEEGRPFIYMESFTTKSVPSVEKLLEQI